MSAPVADPRVPGAYRVRSGRDPKTVYLVQADFASGVAICNCPAGSRGIACKHAKLVLEGLPPVTTSTDTRELTTRSGIDDDQAAALVPIPVTPPRAMLPTRDEMLAMNEIAKSVVHTRGQLVPESIDTPHKAAAIMLAGWELGLRPMTAFRHLFVIDGRVEPDAQVMMGICMAKDASCRFVWHDRTAERASVSLYRNGHLQVQVVYTMQDATRAGLVPKVGDKKRGRRKDGSTYEYEVKPGPWNLYPADKLAWAAVKRACRLGAPDLINAVEGLSSGLVEADYAEIQQPEQLDAPGNSALPAPAEAVDQTTGEILGDDAEDGEYEDVGEPGFHHDANEPPERIEDGRYTSVAEGCAKNNVESRYIARVLGQPDDYVVNQGDVLRWLTVSGRTPESLVNAAVDQKLADAERNQGRRQPQPKLV